MLELRSEYLEPAAQYLATMAHASINQRRKGSGEPYIEHPAGVVAILKSWGYTEPTILSAAWLHDVPEDVFERREGEGLQIIRNALGPEVAQVVNEVTNIARLEDGDRYERAAINRAHLALAGEMAQTLKLADILHNTQNIVAVSPHFAPVWLPEKMADLAVITRAASDIWWVVMKELQGAMQALDQPHP